MKKGKNNIKEDVIERLVAKEKEGFRYGEVTTFLQKLSEETGLSLATVRNIYYTQVKNNISDNDTDTNEHSNDNVVETYTINRKTVRVIEEDNHYYYVAKDVFDSIGVNRSSAIVKNGLPKKHKHYLKVKSTHGYVNTLVISIKGTKELLEHILEHSGNAQINGSCLNFINHLDKNYLATKDEKLNNATSKQDAEVSKDNVPTIYEVQTTNENKLESTTTTIVKSGESLDESIKKHSQLPSNINIDPSPNYRFGDIVEVRVNRLESYGALVETTDIFATRGLIHISDIKNGWVSNPDSYFYVGQILEVKVKNYDSRENRLGLTTKHLDLPLVGDITNKYHQSESQEKTVLGEKLTKIKDKIHFAEKATLEEENDEYYSEYADDNVDEILDLEESGKKINIETKEGETLELKIRGSKELEQIVLFLKQYVGALSPSAKERLLDILNENNIVSFTMAMMEVAPSFVVDPGLRLLDAIEKNIKQGNDSL